MALAWRLFHLQERFMTTSSPHSPFTPLKPMSCQYLAELLPFLQRLAPEVHDRPNGQTMYCFPDGLILNVYATTGRVVFQGAGAAGLTAQAVAERINLINGSGQGKDETNDRTVI